LVVSKCIEFESCRYNGAMIASPVVTALKPLVDFVAVCPEAEIGLGIPREPIRMVRADDDLLLVQPATGLDVTQRMREFAAGFLDGVGEVDGFILKSRSPSCGTKDVKIFPASASTAPAAKGAGFFGAPVLERFDAIPVEDEGRLLNFRLREHFLTRIFTLAALREMAAAGSMRGLVEFHASAKLLLMAYNQKEMRVLGRLVANPEKHPAATVIEAYGRGLRHALAAAPRYTSAINVLMHALGYFSEGLSAREKAFFLESLEAYRQEKIPLSVPVGIVKSYIARFGEPYLEAQRFFQPYPEALVAISDSGKGRDL
jgi:uncharacterized protein YbgA (DUF1722 family)/uncharacterized protein YbbK (DUF523 family)